ncbi:hypothetical protein [Mycobacterium tuberculosis]|uniref:hypothetical protein n=1 Tax=Mycobacterium tuberculosis TaxID=1773 RepID=UPI003459B694
MIDDRHKSTRRTCNHGGITWRVAATSARSARSLAATTHPEAGHYGLATWFTRMDAMTAPT